MRVVIVPTDFSENALNALNCSLEYFKYEKSKFIIVHTYADEVYENKAVISRKLLDEYKETKHKDSERELMEVRKQEIQYASNPRHTFETRAIFGTLLDEVNRLVESENAELIVMGTQGKTTIRKVCKVSIAWNTVFGKA